MLAPASSIGRSNRSSLSPMRMRTCKAIAARLDPFVYAPGIRAKVDGMMPHKSLSGRSGIAGFGIAAQAPRKRQLPACAQRLRVARLRRMRRERPCSSYCALISPAHSSADAIRRFHPPTASGSVFSQVKHCCRVRETVDNVLPSPGLTSMSCAVKLLHSGVKRHCACSYSRMAA